MIPRSARLNGYVTMHGRTGYDVGEASIHRFRQFRQIIPRTIAIRFVECLSKTFTLHQKRRYVFIASDSRPVKNEFQAIAKSHGFIAFVSKFPALHVDFEQDFLSVISYQHYYLLLSDMIWLAFIHTFVEFFATAGGTDFIVNRSEFSRLAYILSDAKSVTKFRPWSNNSCRPPSLGN